MFTFIKMNRNEMDRDLPENYKSQHRDRMYYPNRCNYCFSSENLLKCGSCKTVSYCSKEHQIEDWPFHKPTCIALKEIKKREPVAKNYDIKSFFEYRISLAYRLAKFRSLEHSSLLTDYERQICMLPWVCVVCFKKPSKKFQCEKCQSVAYCSDKHKKMDEKNHGTYCWPWTLCRVCNSLGYQNGYEIRAPHYVYHPIKRNAKRWPENKLGLCDLIENTTSFDLNVKMEFDDYIHATVFVDPYIPAAIIINELEKADLIKKRQLLSKLQKPKLSCIGKQRNSPMTKDKKSRLSKKKTTMVVHFAIADDCELSFEWNDIAQLLTDWITNINKVKIVVTGSNLEDYIVPPCDNQDKIEVIIHKKAYSEVNDLPEPDVVILLECDRIFGLQRHGELKEEHKNAFFKYTNIPVIFCDGHSFVISQISRFLLQFQDLQCVVPVHVNPFTEMKITRVWNQGMTTFVQNHQCVVFMKR